MATGHVYLLCGFGVSLDAQLGHQPAISGDDLPRSQPQACGFGGPTVSPLLGGVLVLLLRCLAAQQGKPHLLPVCFPPMALQSEWDMAHACDGGRGHPCYKGHGTWNSPHLELAATG